VNSQPIIGYQDHLPGANVVIGPPETPGFEIERLSNRVIHDGWATSSIEAIYFGFPADVTADYVGIVYRGFALADTFSVLYDATSLGGGSVSGTNALGTAQGFSRGVTLYPFTSQTSDAWAISFSTALNQTNIIEQVFLGLRLDLPHGMRTGFVPPTLARDAKILNSMSDGGELLGRSVINRGVSMDIRLNNLDGDTFVRGDWDLFVEHAETEPFFFSWDDTNHENEAGFVWSDGPIRKPSYQQYPNIMQAGIKCRGIVE